MLNLKLLIQLNISFISIIVDYLEKKLNFVLVFLIIAFSQIFFLFI